MRIALDTNILVYALGFDDQAKHERCVGVLRELRDLNTAGMADIFVPTQVFMELYAVLRYKKRLSPEECEDRLAPVARVFTHLDTTAADFSEAMDLVKTHKFQIFDATILAISARAACQALITEDMHGGFDWKSCRIVNPIISANLNQTVRDLIGKL